MSKQQKFSNINRKELLLHPEKYITFSELAKYENQNFIELLIYIGTHINCKKKNEIGNAYACIRRETDRLLGIGIGSPRYIRTSKREIRSICSTFESILIKKYSIKITYKASYIFKAIVNILEQIDEPYPDKLDKCVGLMYRLAFYDKHISEYISQYNDLLERAGKEPGMSMKIKMYSEFMSFNSIFNTEFERRK